MTNETLAHIEGGNCWCDDSARRVNALDALYPDRCQMPLLPATPSEIPDDPSSASPTCVRPAGHLEPCRGSLERPGDPCHYCGAPTDPNATGPGCSACWIDLTSMPLADIKALFATLDPDISLNPVPQNGEQHG